MKSRYRDGCFYCEHNQTQVERMVPIIPLDVSTFYLNRDQTHPGRAIVALDWHVDELFELTAPMRQAFIDDVAQAAAILKEYTGASKINYGIYGDTVSHLHFHLVPKLPSDADWDDAFVNNPSDVTPKSDAELAPMINDLRKLVDQNYETLRN
ncbi:HIT family protein [Lacticaseibacillus saniviri]|nr:HIT family protein [Lacticaseibacillus saniviri]